MCDSGRLELCYFVLKSGVQKKERGPEEEKRKRNGDEKAGWRECNVT